MEPLEIRRKISPVGNRARARHASNAQPSVAPKKTISVVEPAVIAAAAESTFHISLKMCRIRPATSRF